MAIMTNRSQLFSAADGENDDDGRVSRTSSQPSSDTRKRQEPTAQKPTTTSRRRMPSRTSRSSSSARWFFFHQQQRKGSSSSSSSSRSLSILFFLILVVSSLVFIRTHHILITVNIEVDESGNPIADFGDDHTAASGGSNAGGFLSPPRPRGVHTRRKGKIMVRNDATGFIHFDRDRYSAILASDSSSRRKEPEEEDRYINFTAAAVDSSSVVVKASALSGGGGGGGDDDDEDKNSQSDSHHVLPPIPWAVFYNIYIPPTNLTNRKLDGGFVLTNMTEGIAVIREQLGQVGSSYAANYYQNNNNNNNNGRDGDTRIKATTKSSSTTPRLKVYYNTIGEPINKTLLDDVICRDENNLDCTHMNHYRFAYEDKTLNRLHQYCHANPDHRVIYMHSKGTYHDRGGRNAYWRRHMTHAVTHRDCMVPPDDTCDMCGLMFFATPWLHFSGNFFTARCRYINKLLPIHDFMEKMNVLHVTTNKYQRQERFLFWIFKNQASYMALGRYASEAWSGSHPSIVACDMSEVRSIDFWKKEVPQREIEANFNFSLAPRATDARGKYLHIRRTKRNKETNLVREYYLLAGNLFKWINLYNGEIPPKKSWVWDFFPNGDIWWNGWLRYGDDVVLGVIDPYAIQDGNLSQWPSEVQKYHSRERKIEEREKRRNATIAEQITIL